MKNKERLNQYCDVAIKALKEYEIEYKELTFFSEDTNIFFKVETSNEPYMLKIFQEESSKIEDNIAEVFFMRYIDEHTDITIPSIILSKEGKDIVFVDSKDFDVIKRVVVYSFIEGESFDQLETNELFEKLGVACAKLHKASKEITIPSHIHPKKWDNVFYYRDEPIVYNDPLYSEITLEENRLFLDKFIPYLNKKLKEFYNRESFIIHADLNPWNVKVHEGEIRLLDFEEAMYASEVHDLAIILFYYRYDANFNYEEVKKHLFKGYLTIRPLPTITNFDLDLLIMARTANFVNYTLYWNDSDPTQYFRSRVKRMMDFVKQYNIEEEVGV